jgi:hypothetical protein
MTAGRSGVGNRRFGPSTAGTHVVAVATPHETRVLIAVRTTHAASAGWRRTMRQDAGIRTSRFTRPLATLRRREPLQGRLTSVSPVSQP